MSQDEMTPQQMAEMARFTQRYMGLAGWIGLLAGLGLTGWLAWNRFSEGEIVAAAGVALVGALLVSPGLMHLTMSLSRYPIAAVGAIVMVFRGR